MTNTGGFDPDDIESIVVVVRSNGQFTWYRSGRDLWVLDLKKQKKEFLDAGFQCYDSDPLERFGIAVVNEYTAASFLAEMQQFEIKTEDLADELRARFPGAKSWWDVSDLFPIMFVDFDRKHVCAFYEQGTRMERYVANGWTSEFEDFATLYPEDRFPQTEKFWVQHGIDMLKELNERGKLLIGHQ